MLGAPWASDTFSAAPGVRCTWRKGQRPRGRPPSSSRRAAARQISAAAFCGARLGTPSWWQAPAAAMARRGGGGEPRRRNRGGEGDRGRIFVCGLLPECEDEDLLRYFTKFGRVDSASVCRAKDTDLSLCCGFVFMGDANTAAAVLEAKAEHRLWEHPVQASREPAAEFAALIEELGVPQRRLAPRRAQADATAAPPPADGAAAEAAEGGPGPSAEAAGAEGAEPAEHRPSRGGQDEGWLFVGRIEHETSEQDLEAMFAAAGAVEKVEVMRDRDGVSRKFAFVKMSDQATADFILSSGQEFKLPGGGTVKVGPYTGRVKRSSDFPRDGHDRGRGEGGWNDRGRGEGGWDRGRGHDRDNRGRDWDQGRAGEWGGQGGGRDDGRGARARSPTGGRGRGDDWGGAHGHHSWHGDRGPRSYARTPPPPPSRQGADRHADRGPARDYGGGAYAGGGAYVD
ncbi:unnamed protein product, partial [Prorocentrum cordatum]